MGMTKLAIKDRVDTLRWTTYGQFKMDAIASLDGNDRHAFDTPKAIVTMEKFNDRNSQTYRVKIRFSGKDLIICEMPFSDISEAINCAEGWIMDNTIKLGGRRGK